MAIDMTARAALDPAEVELANAYGPYTHGVWAGRDLAIGNEEALAGRAAFMVSLIRRSILERFTTEQIREMTLVDVGCYDGWVLCQLADLPFARMIGVEPRKKNLDKGAMIRRLLGIETRCEFRQGTIETLEQALGGQKADVVICTGLLHHLPSTADGVARLQAVCKKFLFVETICFPAALEDDRLRKALELKDLPYFFGSRAFGVTGHKLESGYYDGSATHMSVVSLPSVEALKMFLEVNGFTEIRVEADPASYANAVPGGWRDFSAVCITAVPRPDPIDGQPWIEKYESGVVCTILPDDVTQALYRRYCLHERTWRQPRLAWLAASMTSGGGWRLRVARRLVARQVDDQYAFEIIKNLRFAPHDKVALEHGKCLVAMGRHEEGEQVLCRITRRLNADWRSVYRAFCVLSWARRDRGDLAGASRYEELCRIANPQFPSTLLGGSTALFRALTSSKASREDAR